MKRYLIGAAIVALLGSPSAAKSTGVVHLNCTVRGTMTNTHNGSSMEMGPSQGTVTINFDQGAVFGVVSGFPEWGVPIIEEIQTLIKWQLDNQSLGKHFEGSFDRVSLSGWGTTSLGASSTQDAYENCRVTKPSF
jgi:hypothetical protein